jgi:hypothetical protein
LKLILLVENNREDEVTLGNAKNSDETIELGFAGYAKFTEAVEIVALLKTLSELPNG